jgi:hypothetical protein
VDKDSNVICISQCIAAISIAESGPVRYILDPPTVVPPRGSFGFSNLFVVTGEGHLI